MEGLRALNQYVPVVTDVLCIAGIVVASRTVLKVSIFRYSPRWSDGALMVLVPAMDRIGVAPSPRCHPDTDKPAQPTTTTPVGWRRRIFSGKMAHFLASFVVLFGIEMFIILGVPGIISGTVLNSLGPRADLAHRLHRPQSST